MSHQRSTHLRVDTVDRRLQSMNPQEVQLNQSRPVIDTTPHPHNKHNSKGSKLPVTQPATTEDLVSTQFVEQLSNVWDHTVVPWLKEIEAVASIVSPQAMEVLDALVGSVVTAEANFLLESVSHADPFVLLSLVRN